MAITWEATRTYEDILYEEYNQIAKISINRPEVRNAFRPQTVNELIDAFTYARDDSNIGVIVLAGVGDKAFCSGADLKEASTSGKSAAEILKEYYEPMITAIRDIPKPVVCRMNGLAVGAGCSLALACDIVIAAEDAYLSLAFVQIGLMPDAGATFMLPRLIGMSRAFELASTGRRIPAAEAKQIGLIAHAVPRETLDEETGKLITYYRHAPTRAIGAMKHAFNQSMHSNLPQMLENERESQEMLFGTRDVREGISAFLEKRKPDFQGF